MLGDSISASGRKALRVLVGSSSWVVVLSLNRHGLVGDLCLLAEGHGGPDLEVLTVKALSGCRSTCPSSKRLSCLRLERRAKARRVGD